MPICIGQRYIHALAQHNSYHGESEQCSYQNATSVGLCNLRNQQWDRAAYETDAKACDDSTSNHLAEAEGCSLHGSSKNEEAAADDYKMM